VSGLTVAACKELASADSALMLPAVGGLVSRVCHKCDTASDRFVNAVDSLPEEKSLLPSFCDASVAVADIHVADTSLQEQRPPSVCDADLSSGLADTCTADTQSPQKLQPSSADAGSIAVTVINAADSSLKEKLLPSVNGTSVSNNDNLTDTCDADIQPTQEKLEGLSRAHTSPTDLNL